MNTALALFRPNRVLSRNAVWMLILGQVLILLFAWAYAPSVFLPKPSEILTSLHELWFSEGLGAELITSFYLNVQAIALSTLLSLLLAYSTVMPFFRPIVGFLTKLRFISIVGLSFFFTLMASSGHELKLYLEVFSVTVFFVTGMAQVVAAVPKENYDLARVLGMGDWRIVWEVVVLGQIDKAFEILRQNAAIGWLMLSMVEGISRSEGGVGALMLNQNKHFHLSAVFAIQITIFVLGILQDYAIGFIRGICCPYADLTLERK
jgi:NitT/TauT family transport system permease protein